MMEKKAKNSVHSAMHSASYNMILQVMFRLMTFLLNALIIRYTTRDMLGLVNVRLTLLYSSLLFLSREAFRKSCLTRESNKDQKWKQTINLLWTVVPFGALLTTALVVVWLNFLDLPELYLRSQYRHAVIVFGLCATVELLVEPVWIVSQSYQFIKLKVVAEGGAIGCKCMLTALLIVSNSQLGLYTFCIAQIVHSVVYVSIYFGFFIYKISFKSNLEKDSIFRQANFPFQSPRDMFPTSVQPFIHISQVWLTLSFIKQSFLKQFLTEGERYIMTFFSILTFAEQGLFDVVNNLGSFAARFIFLPLEESFYILFSQLLVRGQPASCQTSDAIELSADSLRGVLKFVSLVGSIILVFGQSYSFLLLDIYGGKMLSSDEGPLLLKWYCLYVLFIAVNGITECFMFACMSRTEVDGYNYKMLGFSMIFLATSLCLARSVGSVGFIIANCLNMGLRIVHSVLFIKRFFQPTSQRPLLAILPSFPVCLVLLVSFICCSVSSQLFCCDNGWFYRFVHVGVGGCCLAAVTMAIFLTEKDFIKLFAKHFFKSTASKVKRN